MNSWTNKWPTEPGWYWSWIEGTTYHKTDKPDLQPARVFIGGSEPWTHIVYIRDGTFFYKAEQVGKTVWWLPLDVPECPDPFGGDY